MQFDPKPEMKTIDNLGLVKIPICIFNIWKSLLNHFKQFLGALHGCRNGNRGTISNLYFNPLIIRFDRW